MESRHAHGYHGSPTATLESITIIGTIEAHEERDIMTADVPNAFIQASIPTKEKGTDRVIMKISGSLVHVLVELDPTYRDYIVTENNKKGN